MSIVEASSEIADESSVQPRIVGDDGLTNKERRKAKQEAKKKQAEEAKVAKVDEKKRVLEQEGGRGEDTPATEGEEAEEPVEALSHKEQRKRRKLEKKGLLPPPASADGGADATPSSSHAKPQRPDLPERSPYAVWVGNLSFQTNIERLQGWFEERGIQGISRVHMPRGVKKFEQNKGFAYIDLPSRSAVESAVALSEDHLDGRRLLIKSSSDFSGRPALDPSLTALATSSNATNASPSVAAAGAAAGPAMEPHGAGGKTGLTKTAQKILRAQRNPAGPTLFVGNLSFNSTEEGLRDLFEASAKARDAWKKAEAGKPKKKAKKVVKKSNSKKAKAEDSDSDSDGGSDSSSASSSASGSSSSSSSSEEDSEDSSDEEDESDEEEEDDKDQVRGAGIRKVRMGTFEDSGKCKGFAFIDFHTPAHATASLVDPRNYRLDGRELKLEFAGADAVRRGAPKGAAINSAGGRGAWPSPNESGMAPPPKKKRAAPEWRQKKGEKRKHLAPSEDSKGSRKRLKREEKLAARREAAAMAPGGAGSPPASGAAGGGVEGARVRHKETQAERQARREKAAAGGGAGGAAGGKRAKPGAALANAQRGKTGIDTSGEAGKRTTFE